MFVGSGKKLGAGGEKALDNVRYVTTNDGHKSDCSDTRDLVTDAPPKA